MKKPKTKLVSRRAGAGTLEKGLRVMEAVEKAGRGVTIQEVAALTGIQRLAVYRLLSTLEERGYVHRSEDKRYRSNLVRRRLLVGYAAPLSGTPFREDVTSSIEQAASRTGVELMMLDNRDEDAAAAMHNASILLERRVDAAMFFQPVESVGHMMADRFLHARVPFITIEGAIQGGVYFGGNNYQAGKLAGAALGKFALKEWEGRFDLVVLLEGAKAASNAQARLAGALVAIGEVLGKVEDSRVIHLDGNACRESSREAMARLLQRLPRRTRLLVSGFNDPSSVGALQAVIDEAREEDVAIVGQNATREGRAGIRGKGSRLIASVAYFPERYGEKLLPLASALARGEPVPPAVYTEHRILDRDNIDRVYPESETATQPPPAESESRR
jgi:ribose transport system substrate-binding protein